MQTLQIRPDIVVQSADRNVVALVEIKNLPDLSPEVAAIIRGNLMAHGLAHQWARYFLLVSQEVGYLWDRASLGDAPNPLPAATFPMRPVVERYLPSFVTALHLSESHLELAVIQWLWDVANELENRPHETESALAPTGFLDLIKGGRVGLEPAD
jgi:hypothetical protein